MKIIGLWLICVAAAAAQPFGFGIKGGLPMTDLLHAARNQNFDYTANTNRYIIGPSAELRLPFGFGVEFDVLYRHFSYNLFNGGAPLTSTLETRTTGSAWEFPLVAKYKLKGGWVRPYVEAGVSWDRLSGLSQDVKAVVNNVTNTSSVSSPPELNQKTTRGFVMGAGLDIKAILIHVSPEIRYTRWGARHFISVGELLNSNQNQGEFLIGFKF